MRVWMIAVFVSSLLVAACGSKCPAGTYDNGTTCVYQSTYGTQYGSQYPTYNNGYTNYPSSTYPSYGGSGYYGGY